MKTLSIIIGMTALMLAGKSPCMAQEITAQAKTQVTERMNQEIERQRISMGKARIDSVASEKKVLKLMMNANVGYLPFREENVAEMYRDIAEILKGELKGRRLELWANGRRFEQLIPAYTRTTKNKEKTWAPRVTTPLVTPVDLPYQLTGGLKNRHIAMWQSHGWYYERKLDRWEWQRARILQTVEDLYTQSYVLPFLVPMLENAGANVLLPRERDTRSEEMIVDNDGCLNHDGAYAEENGTLAWTEGQGTGFAHKRQQYGDWENPFTEGTYRMAKTTKKNEESLAKWTLNIPERGEYGVYVSYKTLPNSTEDALYTVHHLGGKTSFRVNQQMGGGTWIYLGKFLFEKGQNPEGCITLTNRSAKAGRIVTADAVKVGGGMGNIARNGQLSEYPRWTEGARYWLQWAGAPDSVYSRFHGENDYNDDYCSRADWVNWMAGGSDVLPQRDGLHVPIDLSLAFHSDAGTTKNDTIIGTLLIYETETQGRDTYSNGASRYLAGELADLVQTQIVSDVRALHAPEWHRRGKWNSSYYEARVPEVPAILLELLSHQNFADMRYGLDPRFRFTVSRAIYKGMLQFICSQRGTPYVVQPMPVDHMAAELTGNNEAELTWQPVDDPLETTAKAERYVVYTRIDNKGWDNGQVVETNRYKTSLQPGHLYSWKVAALNQGGRSFDSEILSAGIAKEGQRPVLVVNGFDRVSAPADFEAPGEGSTEMAGFLDDVDHGVPYLQDISYIGKMKEFRRDIPWMDDDASGFGDSYADQETHVIAGNTFDYPALHGAALMAAGQSFTSCSNEVIEQRGTEALAPYPMVDLILGKQWQTKMGNGKNGPLMFKTFTEPMQKALTAYLQQGGRLMATGAYVATDLWDNPLAKALDEDKKFATEVLKFKWRANQAAKHGGLKTVESALSQKGQKFGYSDTLNDQCYVVESPDALEPAGEGAYTVMRYTENNLSAAVAYRCETYATFIMGVPFETIRTASEREQMMKNILEVLKWQ